MSRPLLNSLTLFDATQPSSLRHRGHVHQSNQALVAEGQWAAQGSRVAVHLELIHWKELLDRWCTDRRTR